jgi:integrase/recombinase XerD
LNEIIKAETATVSVIANHRALAGAWLESLRTQAAAGMFSAVTITNYSRTIKKWLDWLDHNSISHPMPADVFNYVAELRTQYSGPGTVNAHLWACRSLYRWAETQNLYPAIARSVRGLKETSTSEPLDCLLRQDVAGLLDYIDGGILSGKRDIAIIRVLFATGLRLVSLCELNVNDFNALEGMLTYRGKGDVEKGRKAYLGQGAISALCRYLEAREGLTADAPLFTAIGNRAGGKRLSSRSIRRIITDLMEAAGHIHRDGKGHIDRPRVFSAHSLRRSAVTTAYEAAGIEAAQTLAGHADPKTTARHYARVQKGRMLRGLTKTLDLEATA